MPIYVDIAGYLDKHSPKKERMTQEVIASGVGITRKQFQRFVTNKQKLVNLEVLANIIAFMRANGHPDFDVSDLLKYEPD